MGVGGVLHSGLIVDGALSGAFVNLMCGLLMIVVIGAALIKDMIDKKRDDEEDEQ